MPDSNFTSNWKQTKQSVISFKKLKSNENEIIGGTENNYADKELSNQSSPVPINTKVSSLLRIM